MKERLWPLFLRIGHPEALLAVLILRNGLQFFTFFTYYRPTDVDIAGWIFYFFTFLYLMLDYVKIILLKVSFSKALFEKELRKALKMLLPAELPDFRSWCYQQFSRLYRRVLKRVFAELSPGA